MIEEKHKDNIENILSQYPDPKLFNLLTDLIKISRKEADKQYRLGHFQVSLNWERAARKIDEILPEISC